MGEPLEIRAINIRERMGEFPKQKTIPVFGSEENEKKVLDILDKCDNSGFMKVGEGKKLKEFFQVEQILYRGQWERFENYNSEGHSDRTDFNNYIMPFDQFQKLGRPKKIYIDFYNSVSLKD